MLDHSQSLRNNLNYNQADGSCDDLYGLFNSGTDDFNRFKLVAKNTVLRNSDIFIFHLNLMK